jgi:hypothetical protein
MGEHHSRMNCTLTKSAPLSTTSQRCRTWIDIAIRRNRSGRRLASESSTNAAWLPSRLARQSTVRIGSPKTAEATLKPTRGFRGSAGMRSLPEFLLSHFMHVLAKSKSLYFERALVSNGCNLRYIIADGTKYSVSKLAIASTDVFDRDKRRAVAGRNDIQSANLTPILRSLRQITSQRWLSESPGEIRRNVSGGVECWSSSIIAPDLLRSQTRQSRPSCGAPKKICPTLRADLRASLLKSSAIVCLRTLNSHDIGDCLKSKLPLKTVFAPAVAVDTGRAA